MRLNPVTRLALSYLAIIMLMSVGFSLFLYNVSSGALNRQLRRQEVLSTRGFPLPSGFANFAEFRERVLSEGLSVVEERLILFNLGVLLVGGAASYALAVYTLRPITEAMEAQSRFTADASHELRTPLTAMQTEIEVSLRDPKLTKQQAKALLASNLEEVGKLRALSDALLRLARHDDSQPPHEKVNLKQIGEDALARVAKAAQAKDIKLQNQLLPVEVIGDPDSLRELIVVLLDNAIKYSEAGKEVSFEVRPGQKQAMLTVKDQGHGIEPAAQPRIFERFFRADPSRSKEKAGGYGLGLAIAKQIVERHHGTISVTSQPGQGSSFTVKLPQPAQSSS